MHKIELEITAESSLALGRQKPGSVSEVENYIPGTVLRGAIAAQILQQAGNANQSQSGDFEALFLGNHPAIFQNAYPAIAQVGENQWDVISQPTRILPATAMSSKTTPGFKSAGHGGVFDTLIDSFCAAAFQHPYEFTDPSATERGTNPQAETYGGFYSRDGDHYSKHEISSRFLTRVGINRRRATAEEAVLYTVAVLNESFAKRPKQARYADQDWQNVVFRSAILLPDDGLAKVLIGFINHPAQQFRIGGSASRGLGKIILKATSSSQPNALKTRLEKFKRALSDRWKLWSVFGQPQTDLLRDRLYFTLNLQADAILNENWQRTTVISTEMLQQFTGITDESLRLHSAYSSYDYRSGWNAAWGLMKDIELATSRGSTYLYSVEQSHEDEWIRALEQLEEQGVGDRTAEGFGQVQICDEFHSVFREGAV